MTYFSVPDDLLRAGETSAARAKGPADHFALALRGVAACAASSVMFVVVALPMAGAALVLARRVLHSLPTDLRRGGTRRVIGVAVAGVIAGIVATSAINEAQGHGATTAAGVVVGLLGVVALVEATRLLLDTPVAPTAASTAALDIRGLEFAYGTQQVLFGVSLRVEQGAIAALLGTNGAGKSTILRAVAGLDPPVLGTIQVFGKDTTYADAEVLVREGVALLAGGRMTFPSLTVDENLRVGAYTTSDADMAAVYRRFPALAPRRQQRAGTLSGGEQQMLALGRVLLTRPRLLLIDELTLGLAPKVVEELIAIVREVNASGTTVLLVEQSVNLALTLADHSFFLERGEVRFDGPTRELLTRDDLLRPVFLSSEG